MNKSQGVSARSKAVEANGWICRWDRLAQRIRVRPAIGEMLGVISQAGMDHTLGVSQPLHIDRQFGGWGLRDREQRCEGNNKKGCHGGGRYREERRTAMHTLGA